MLNCDFGVSIPVCLGLGLAGKWIVSRISSMCDRADGGLRGIFWAIFDSQCTLLIASTRNKGDPVPKSPQASGSSGKTEGFWAILDGGSRLRTLLLVASGVFLLIMLGQFLVSVILGAILAAITWPLRVRLVTLLKGRVVLASILLEVGLVLGILVPVGVVFFLALIQVRDLTNSIDMQEFLASALAILERLRSLPLLSGLGLRPEVIVERMKEALPGIATWGVGRVAQYSLGLFQAAVTLALMLLCLFYMHLAGDSMAWRIQRILPLPQGETASLMEVFRRTAVAILKGNFVIAAIQGLLTGVLFASVGIPSPVFFGVVAALCSLVPSIGSALVWFPAALILLLSGNMAQGIVVLLVGSLVISMIDNLLRPVLVGRETGMHDLMVLLTTLGGISFFGPIGILFGPLVGAVFLALLASHEAESDIGPKEEATTE